MPYLVTKALNASCPQFCVEKISKGLGMVCVFDAVVDQENRKKLADVLVVSVKGIWKLFIFDCLDLVVELKKTASVLCVGEILPDVLGYRLDRRLLLGVKKQRRGLALEEKSIRPYDYLKIVGFTLPSMPPPFPPYYPHHLPSTL